MSSRVLVVGGSLSGLRAAEQLRAAGHTGPVTVVGQEPHLPYNRPPLSKAVLSDPDELTAVGLRERLAFRRRRSVDDVEFVLGRWAVGSDVGSGRVTLDDGSVLGYDGLVVATGLRSRRLDVPGPVAGRFAIRTLDDAVALRAALVGRTTAIVVGGGFIGCETAATLCRLGMAVTVVEPCGTPMAPVLGTQVGAAVQRHLEAAGIRFELGVAVDAFTGADHVTGVRLSDGRTVAADVVVESVGSICNTEWLDGNGLDLADGVRTDNDLRAAGAAGVVAVGDVARFPNPLFDDVPRRVEHWSMPTDTAKRAAVTLVAALAGGDAATEPFAPVPSFWSDQLDLRLQSFGSPGLADEVRLDEGDPDRPADGLLATYRRGGDHVGSLAVNLPPARQRELRDAFSRPAPAAS